jgi:hypothetical protein
MPLRSRRSGVHLPAAASAVGRRHPRGLSWEAYSRSGQRLWRPEHRLDAASYRRLDREQADLKPMKCSSFAST